MCRVHQTAEEFGERRAICVDEHEGWVVRQVCDFLHDRLRAFLVSKERGRDEFDAREHEVRLEVESVVPNLTRPVYETERELGPPRQQLHVREHRQTKCLVAVQSRAPLLAFEMVCRLPQVSLCLVPLGSVYVQVAQERVYQTSGHVTHA